MHQICFILHSPKYVLFIAGRLSFATNYNLLRLFFFFQNIHIYECFLRISLSKVENNRLRATEKWEDINRLNKHIFVFCLFREVIDIKKNTEQCQPYYLNRG